MQPRIIWYLGQVGQETNRIFPWVVSDYDLTELTPAEHGGKRGSSKPEAILKWANPPIAMLAGLWEELRQEWIANSQDPRPPVCILVCKNTKIAKVMYEWIAEDKSPEKLTERDSQFYRSMQKYIALTTIMVLQHCGVRKPNEQLRHQAFPFPTEMGTSGYIRRGNQISNTVLSEIKKVK